MCEHILTESKQANVLKRKLIPLLRGREHHIGKEQMGHPTKYLEKTFF